MIHLLAELPDPTSPAAIGAFALTGFAIVGGIEKVLRIIDRNKPNPALHQQFASKEEVSAMEKRFAGSIEEMKRDLSKSNEKTEDMVLRIYDKLDDLKGTLIARDKVIRR